MCEYILEELRNNEYSIRGMRCEIAKQRRSIKTLNLSLFIITTYVFVTMLELNTHKAAIVRLQSELDELKQGKENNDE